MKFYNKPTIKKAAILTIAILGNVSGISLAAERRSAPTNTPDFTINQRVHLNNLQGDITRVELKCALTCKVPGPAQLGPVWRKDLFRESTLFAPRWKVAGFSQTFQLPINNGSINVNQVVKIDANIEGAKKEHVDGYVCALALYEQNRRVDERELRTLPWHEERTDGPLPPGIQKFPTRFETISRINNLHNPSNFSDCKD